MDILAPAGGSKANIRSAPPSRARPYAHAGWSKAPLRTGPRRRSWPFDPDVETLLSDAHRKAIIAAWAYLDTHLYHPSGSHVARDLARHLILDEPIDPDVDVGNWLD